MESSRHSYCNSEASDVTKISVTPGTTTMDFSGIMDTSRVLQTTDDHAISIDGDEEGPPDFRYRHLSDMMSTLGALWRKRLYTDLSLVVEKKVIRCHKIMLAAASPYFHTRLFNGRRETPIEKIFITNIPRSAVEDVLDYIYTGECALNVDNAEDILKTANVFQLHSLHDMVDLYLSENIDFTNCLRLYRLANNTGSPLMRDQAIWMIKNNFMSLHQDPMFKQLSCKELITVLETEGLNVPDETAVSNAIISWLDADRDKRRFMLGEILRRVKLPKLRKEHIKQVLDSDQIVKGDIVCQRLMRRVRRSQQTEQSLAVSDRISSAREFIDDPSRDDVILVIGGVTSEDSKFKCKQQVLAFNLSFRKFYPLCSLPMGCDSGVAYCKVDDDVFVSGLGESRQYLARFNSAQNSWRMLAPMTLGRRGHAMIVLGKFIYILGGMLDQVVDGAKRITTSIDKYDIRRNRWTYVANLPEGVWGCSAVVHSDKIVVFGGYHSRDSPSTSVQTFEPKTGLSRITSQLPFPVALTQTVVCDGVTYIVCPTGNILKTNDCWRFHSVCALPDFKRAMFGVAVHRGRLIVAGGKFNNDVYSDMLMVDLSSQTQVVMPEKLPMPMYGFGWIPLPLSRKYMLRTAFDE